MTTRTKETRNQRINDALVDVVHAFKVTTLAIEETDDLTTRLALGQAALRLGEARHELERARTSGRERL